MRMKFYRKRDQLGLSQFIAIIIEIIAMIQKKIKK